MDAIRSTLIKRSPTHYSLDVKSGHLSVYCATVVGMGVDAGAGNNDAEQVHQ